MSMQRAQALGSHPRLFLSVFSTVLLLGPAVGSGPLQAQASGRAFDPGIGGGAYVEGYYYEDSSVAGREALVLGSAPFFFDVTFARDFYFRVDGAYAYGAEVLPGGGENTLSGLTDTNLRLDWRIGRDAVVISALGSLPTGDAELTQAEARLAGSVAADLFPFRVSNWGAGGYFGFQVAGTRQIGAVGVGASVAYLSPGEFEPFADDPILYQPGQQLRVQLALDGRVGRAGQWSLLGGWQNNEDDIADGANLFQAGQRYDLTATYTFATGSRSVGAFYGGLYHRDVGEYVDPQLAAEAGQVPAQDLILVGMAFRNPSGTGWLIPRVDGRILRREDGLNQGWLASAGVSWESGSRGVVFIPTVSGRGGKLVIGEDSETWVYGLEVGLSLRIGR